MIGRLKLAAGCALLAIHMYLHLRKVPASDLVGVIEAFEKNSK